MKIFGTIACLVCALVLSGCATSEFAGTIKAPGFESVRGAPVYIYSFLDAREDQFGPTMLDRTTYQLSEQLAEKGVRTQLLTFKESPLGLSYVFSDTTGMLPVDAVIRRNQPAEAALGAKYRLIIFPAAFNLYETAQSYEIRWMLVDVVTDRIVWRTSTLGSRTIWSSNDEDAEQRATTLVSGVIAEMAASQLF